MSVSKNTKLSTFQKELDLIKDHITYLPEGNPEIGIFAYDAIGYSFIQPV
jgi:hypothetical protein